MTLIVPTGSTLDLNNLRSDARALQNTGTIIGGAVTIVPDGGQYRCLRQRSARLLLPGKRTIGRFSGEPDNGSRSRSIREI